MDEDEVLAHRRNVASKDKSDSPETPSSSASASSSSSSPTTPPQPEITSQNAEYCKQLEHWLWQCYWHRSIAVSAYFTALNQNYGQASTISASGDSRQQGRPPPAPGFRINFNVFTNQLNNNQPIPTTTSGEQAVVVKIAPIWKRIVAEIVDFMILMIVKLLVTFAIVDNFDVIDFDNIDLSSFQQQDADLRIASLYDLAFTISSELIFLEIIHRILACLVEGYCLSKSGCTPGKSLLNLRVIHAEHIHAAPDNQPAGDVQFVAVTPASYLSFPRAFVRSAVKNFSLAFFFPLCFTLFHFEYSRTLYDMMGKSLVIENH